MKDFTETLDSIRKDMLKTGHFYILRKENCTKPNYSHINNGYCGVFSSRVCEEFEDALEMSCKDLGYSENDICHYFVKYNGKYYDAECIEGVKNPKDLPLIRRFLDEDTLADKMKRFLLKFRIMW